MVTTALQPGIHPGISSSRYHDWKMDKDNIKAGPISCSLLKRFSPSAYEWRWGKDKEETEALRMGKLFDYALLEPELLLSEVVVSPYDNYRTKAAQEWRKEGQANGLLIVSEEQLARAKKAALRVREHAEAGPVVNEADYQVAVVGEVGNVPAKCLIDILPREEVWEETIWDYKTTEGLEDDQIRKTIGNFGYGWQGAFYRTLWNQVSPDLHCESFGFIFQDRNTLEVRLVRLTQDELHLSNRGVRKALEGLMRAAHYGVKSRFERGVRELGRTPYQAMNEEERLDQLEEEVDEKEAKIHGKVFAA